MNTIDAIINRHSVREFSDKAISDDMLKKILEAGRFSPSPLNSQPWSFIVIKNKSILKELVPLALHGNFLQNANIDIVVTIDENAKVDSWLAEQDQHVYGGACAIMNMWLASWDLGIGACWVSLDDKMARKILTIPDNQKIIGSIALGYPKGQLPHHKAEERKPLNEFVFYEHFGSKSRSFSDPPI